MTEFKTLKGKGKWVRLSQPDATFGEPSWKLDLYISPEYVAEFKSWKLKNRVHSDDDGDYVHLKRPCSQNKQGKTLTYSPPIVVDKEGNPTNSTNIGNGSDLTVTLEYYGWPGRKGVLPGWAVRLHKVQVDNLVEYLPNKPQETANETEAATLSP